MNVAMRYQGIVSLVATKMEDARFHAMLSFFMKDATSVEAKRMARLVASTEGDSGEFERQARTAFENLCQKQGGGDVINVEKLCHWLCPAVADIVRLKQRVRQFLKSAIEDLRERSRGEKQLSE